MNSTIKPRLRSPIEVVERGKKSQRARSATLADRARPTWMSAILEAVEEDLSWVRGAFPDKDTYRDVTVNEKVTITLSASEGRAVPFTFKQVPAVQYEHKGKTYIITVVSPCFEKHVFSDNEQDLALFGLTRSDCEIKHPSREHLHYTTVASHLELKFTCVNTGKTWTPEYKREELPTRANYRFDAEEILDMILTFDRKKKK